MLLFRGKITDSLKHKLAMWTITSTDEKTQSDIKRQIVFFNGFVVLNSVIISIASWFYAARLSDDVNAFFALRLIHEYFPKSIFEVIYRVTNFVLGQMMCVHVHQTLYYTQHINIQVQMFKKIIRDLENESKIEQQLKFCIERHAEFIKIITLTTKELRGAFVGFAFGGLLLGVAVAFYIFSGLLTPEYYLRVGAIGLASVVNFAVTIWFGQSTESHLDELMLAVGEVQWYNFSQRNKKVYLILLMNVMKGRKWRVSEEYSVNYRLGLAIVRGVYSIISVTSSYKKS
ncbi:uncharacterized protein LOC107398775 [Tribolium castaneum]